jgi:hypothetical protein
MQTYEEKLNRDFNWALREGGMHFKEESEVHRTLSKLTQKLEELGIDYAVVGGMAMFHHGFRRFTEDVDLLVTQDGLRRIHEELEGRGYVTPFSGSKNLRDTETGVRIEFLITGHFPGDGKPKAVAFPNPADVAVELHGIRCLGLESLITLKIVSGTSAGRLKDLGDVQELIRSLHLPISFKDRLDRSVQESFERLWNQIQQSPTEEQL